MCEGSVDEDTILETREDDSIKKQLSKSENNGFEVAQLVKREDDDSGKQLDTKGEISGGEDTQLDKRETNDVRRQLWKMLRPRPKLWFSNFCKMLTNRSRCEDIKTFLSQNIVYASLSVAMGMCFLLQKFGATRSINAPYSDLLTGIRNGSIKRVQFKENSRQIVYNKLPSVENLRTSRNKSIAMKSKFNSDIGNGVSKFRVMLADVSSKFPKTQDFFPSSRFAASTFREENNGLCYNQVPSRGWQYTTRGLDIDKLELLDLMKEKGTTFGVDPEPFFISLGRKILTTMLNQAPSWAMLLLISRGLMGSSNVGRKPDKQQVVTFDDVEGVDAAKTELLEVVSCMQGDDNYENLGVKLPRGVLLVGPPGTGKTLLARAVAEKAGVPFFITCASEFVEMFVGRGASRIRELFKEAKKCAPSIIFIDEIDAAGLRRGIGFNTEGDQTLNQLLTEMDGFESDKKMVVIAATNRAELLDPALLRPGRFSRKVYVREPDEDGRRKILAVHLRGVPLEEDTSSICNLVASLTEGLVGADLANIVNEAAFLAARRGGKCVSREDIMVATERTKYDVHAREQHSDWHEQAEHLEIIPVHSSRIRKH